MTQFFRFPKTPHLAWLGAASVPRDAVTRLFERLFEVEFDFLRALRSACERLPK